MASKTAILSIRIIADGKQAGSEFAKTNAEVSKFDDGLRKASVGAGVALAGIGALAVAAGNAASDLQQATGAVESVFGAHAAQVKEYAENAATNVGLAASEYSQLSAVVGSQLKNMGVPMGDVAGQTNDLVGLGADLAATFGGTTSDAVAALSSLLRGERDPIERYGVSIKQATIEAKLAEMGLADLEGEARTAAETQAVLALLTEQTADAQGQFAREADTAAGAQQRANAQWQDAQAQLGEVLLPIMADLAGKLADVAQWVTENSTEVTILVGIIAGFAAGILILNGAITAYRTIATVATAAQIAWNLAMTANPIGLIITAIGLLVAAIVLIATNWEDVQKVVADVWESIIGWIEDGIGWIQDAIGWFGELLGIKSQAESGGIGDGGWDVPPVPPTWGAFDEVLYSAYLADQGDDADGTGGWEGWSAPYTTSDPAERAGDTYYIDVHGAIDVDGVARAIEDVMDKHARKTGRGGDTRWR